MCVSLVGKVKGLDWKPGQCCFLSPCERRARGFSGWELPRGSGGRCICCFSKGPAQRLMGGGPRKLSLEGQMNKRGHTERL